METLNEAPLSGAPLLTEAQVAKRLGMSRSTLAQDRKERSFGLPYVRIGASIRYRPDDLERFIAERVVA